MSYYFNALSDLLLARSAHGMFVETWTGSMPVGTMKFDPEFI
jgi:hypothetical protein